MPTKFDIRPYEGVGPLRFGMTPDEVEQLLGKPNRVKKSFFGERTEHREANGLVATFDKGADKLIEVGFSPNIAGLHYANWYLFIGNPRDTLHELAKYDTTIYEMLGFIIMLKLGITLTGFQTGEQSDMAVTVFAMGRWDSDIPKMRRIFL
jgi:hypothetical protein